MLSSAFKYLIMYDTVQEVFNKATLISEEKTFITKLLLLPTSNQALFYFFKKRENKWIVCYFSPLTKPEEKFASRKFLIKPQGLSKHPDTEYE